MKKQKRWQTFLIATVTVLTIYNIAPTIFYYSKPLKAPITEKQGHDIALEAMDRVNSLENESRKWIQSFNELLGIKAYSIAFDETLPSQIKITFATPQDADTFKNHLPRAGSLIPFTPAKLALGASLDTDDLNCVTLKRSIPIHFEENDYESLFSFGTKRDENGNITPEYKEVIVDRASQIALHLGGVHQNGLLTETINANSNLQASVPYIFTAARNISNYHTLFEKTPAILNRFFASFTQNSGETSTSINALLTSFNAVKDQIRLEKVTLQDKASQAEKSGDFLTTKEQETLEFLLTQESTLSQATTLLQKNQAHFAKGSTPLDYKAIKGMLNDAENPDRIGLDLSRHHPLVDNLVIDFEHETIDLNLHADILRLKAQKTDTQQGAALDDLLFDTIAHLTQVSGDKLTQTSRGFQVNLCSLTGSESFLTLKLDRVAEKTTNQLLTSLQNDWTPSHKDLTKDNFPLWNADEYQALKTSAKKLGLLVYAPVLDKETKPASFRNSSIYVIAKGLSSIVSKFESAPNSPQAQEFLHDFEQLKNLLASHGFYGYPGASHGQNSQFSKDFIFESEEYYAPLLKATRENFSVFGTKRHAVLEFTNLKQRLMTANRIDSDMQDELIKWKSEYNQSKVSLGHASKSVPKPTRNTLVSNFLVSFKKYFRGDERKILNWGIDLSGGKTVQIELRDNQNRLVDREAEIKQGMNELFARVNKLGVSEVAIRQEGSGITLEFPSAQGVSAGDLIQASSMQFHIVNESFATTNSRIGNHVNHFLQGVWNEAVVTNRKDLSSINQIAFRHLYGDTDSAETARPPSDTAKALYDQGLRLAHPKFAETNSTFDDTTSKIALFRGDSHTEWHGQSHPLLVIFKNHALEGSALEHVRAAYDPTQGNHLTFGVKSSLKRADGSELTPRADLYNWSSTFCRDSISGTSRETASNGRGWRMAVVLNGSVINAPTLQAPIRDNVLISGNFTEREVQKLETDLKAGSLSFAPHILSEKNISPSLGLKDRMQGINATILALVLVVVVMVLYYRFAGVIASVAVLFNLLIMWAALQNIQATLTLAGIAGAILTLGMAVDANVLVFERIREEFALTGKISSAIKTGYQKAFTAILDANVTTIIAAVILLNFDSGPIKGLAIMLIIGIVSSMFTALFMTRTFFEKWAMSTKKTSLKMSNFIKVTKVNFLKYKTVCFTSVALLIACGTVFLGLNRNTILGMDFTGGQALIVECAQTESGEYRQSVENALLSAGLSNQEFEVRSLHPANQIKISLASSLELEGRPFHKLPLSQDRSGDHAFTSNPRIAFVVNALETSGVNLTAFSLNTVQDTWTSVSGQMSDAMRNSALIGMSIALLCILVYITARFEFKYALSATLCLGIDVLATLSMLGILHACGAPINIDLNTIAALMTIIGYSLNDTIVIFDRIRETLKAHHTGSLDKIVNGALRTTLSRTLMTSSTTLVVLLALALCGGQAIFGLAVVMIIGVVFGTFSSIFIASPLMLMLHKRETKKAPSKVVEIV